MCFTLQYRRIFPVQLHRKNPPELLNETHPWYTWNSWQVLYNARDNNYKVRCAKKATIHQVATTLATSKNVLYPGHANHLY